jgi:cob(I)alamin adenosyltransferase
MKIYTRRGDRGDTGILGGGRLTKAAPRIRAIGTVDELIAALGVVAAQSTALPELGEQLARIQSTLFEAGAALASPDPSRAADLFPSETEWVEGVIDRTEEKLPPLDRFILPGGSPLGALLHWARTVCRRAEAEVVAAVAAEPGRANLLAYLNRVSDLLFVLARAANDAEGQVEKPWESRLPGTGRSPEK